MKNLTLDEDPKKMNYSSSGNKPYNFLDKDELEKLKEIANHKNIFLGFDAFIDVTALPIKTGNGSKPLTYFETTQEFGGYLNRLSGNNCSIELLDGEPRIGGNMAITAKAVSGFGINTHCVGTFGYPKTHPIFSDMAHDCNLISIGNPGEAIVLEFKNGKIIFGMNREVNNLNWDTIKARAGISKVQRYFNISDLIFLLNWSELPGSTGIFRGVLKELISKATDKKIVFIDFSDCRRRERNEILEILSIVALMHNYAKVVLSLNENEAQIICSALDINSNNVCMRGNELTNKLGIEAVFFHSRSGNTVVTSNECITLLPELEHNPALNVGAGDNFNAGAAIGLLMDLPLDKTLKLATKTASYYVKYGKNYNFKEDIHAKQR